jgi:hypothetical protein
VSAVCDRGVNIVCLLRMQRDLRSIIEVKKAKSVSGLAFLFNSTLLRITALSYQQSQIVIHNPHFIALTEQCYHVSNGGFKSSEHSPGDYGMTDTHFIDIMDSPERKYIGIVQSVTGIHAKA